MQDSIDRSRNVQSIWDFSLDSLCKQLTPCWLVPFVVAEETWARIPARTTNSINQTIAQGPMQTLTGAELLNKWQKHLETSNLLIQTNHLRIFQNSDINNKEHEQSPNNIKVALQQEDRGLYYAFQTMPGFFKKYPGKLHKNHNVPSAIYKQMSQILKLPNKYIKNQNQAWWDKQKIMVKYYLLSIYQATAYLTDSFLLLSRISMISVFQVCSKIKLATDYIINYRMAIYSGYWIYSSKRENQIMTKPIYLP
eukprot:403363667